jgi:FMN phosphatase YigB (HAD superfamily)
VFVDDMLENVAAAQALGMRGVRFINTAQAVAEIKRYLDDQAQI